MTITATSRQNHCLAPFRNSAVNMLSNIALASVVVQALSQIRRVAAVEDLAISEKFKQKEEQGQQDWSASVIESAKKVVKSCGPHILCGGLSILSIVFAEGNDRHIGRDVFRGCMGNFGYHYDIEPEDIL